MDAVGGTTTRTADSGIEPTVIWTPNKGPQTWALQCPVDEIFFGGARGGGKTQYLKGDWIRHSTLYGPNAKGMVIRKTLQQLRDFIADIKPAFRQLGAVWKEQDKTFYFPNGSTLRLAYLENDADAENYQGWGLTWLSIDEVGNFKTYTPVDMLSGAMRSGAGVPSEKRLTGNPGGVGHKWLYDRYVRGKEPYTPYFRVMEDTDKYLYFRYGSVIPTEYLKMGTWQVFIPSKIEDNPQLLENDPQYINRLHSSGSKALVKAWLDGNWEYVIDGDVFNEKWWKRYEVLPPDSERLHIIQSWDTAYKTEEKNDRSVCTTWGIYSCGFFLLDCWAGKLQFPDLKKKAVELAEQWKCYDILIEDKATGTSLVQELQRDTLLALRPIQPKGDKLTRACSASPIVEGGRVYIPRQSPWLQDFLLETSQFPKGGHDDIVDSTSQALNYISANYAVSGSYTYETVNKNSAKAEPAQNKTSFLLPASLDDAETTGGFY